MNGYTKDIAALLNVDIETALKIQKTIDEQNLLDYSECSTTRFNKVVKYVYNSRITQN